MEFRPVTLPFITTVDKAREAVAKIDQAGREEGARPIVFATLVNNEVRDALKQAHCLFLDFFDAFLGPLEQELGQPSAHVLGRAHGMADLTAYTMRINATNFALANDDGAQTRDYDRADVILHRSFALRQDADLRVHGAAVRRIRGQLPADRGRPRRRAACPRSSSRTARSCSASRSSRAACSRSARSAGRTAATHPRSSARSRCARPSSCSSATASRISRRPTRPSRRSRAACSSASRSRGA